MNLRLALSCVLYVLAAPVYALLGVRKLGKMLRARRVLAGERFVVRIVPR